jgi:hypothetical protein
MGTDFDRKKGELLMLAAGKSGSEEAVAYLTENAVSPERLLAEARAEKYGYKGGV